MTKEEQLMSFLIEEDKKDDTEKIYLYKEDLTKIGLLENEVIKIANELEKKGYIRIHTKSPHNNLSTCMAISILSSHKFYFNKNKTSKTVAYFGNEKVDSIVKTLLNSSIDDNDLHIIEAVLDKYKK